ncbi:hypothetical protein [Wolbachia endosymbiont of Phyllotreta cruciferae]|nr:hypothetical protein [Wolbachia endosymbiont of Phyllotreta cruciferae]
MTLESQKKDDVIPVRDTGMTLSWMESYFHDIILFPGSQWALLHHTL